MTAPPEYLADRPATPADLLRPPGEFADPPAFEDAALGLGSSGQPLDLLSELLRSVRLSGERIVAYAPQRTFSTSFAGIGTLHIVEEGELALWIDGDAHVERVGRGDVILLPRGDPHHISDAAQRARATGPAGAPGHDAPAPSRRAGSAERSRSATRRRATCSRASRPRSSCAAPAARRWKGSRWPAGCSSSRCSRPLRDRR